LGSPALGRELAHVHQFGIIHISPVVSGRLLVHITHFLFQPYTHLSLHICNGNGNGNENFSNAPPTVDHSP